MHSANTATSAGKHLSPSERDKIAFLSSPDNYPEPTASVTVVETHHAWIFLTDRYAWKMKKTFRHGRVEYSSLAARRHLCNEEYRLNLPLAPLTYLGVVPLRIDEDRGLHIDGDGRPVEWLVKMHRLPEEHMLDVAAPANRVKHEDIGRLMSKLLDFQAAAQTCRPGPAGYVSRLQQEVAATVREIRKPAFGFPTPQADALADRLHAYIERERDLLDGRERDGRVRELHGDLRPEHVCLLPGGDIEILDRLEFDPALRCLDCVEELAYFGMECRAIGQPWIEPICRECYRKRSNDDVPAHLWQFYAARRATIRAMLAAWHTLDGEDHERWLRRGRHYLALADDYLG